MGCTASLLLREDGVYFNGNPSRTQNWMHCIVFLRIVMFIVKPETGDVGMWVWKRWLLHSNEYRGRQQKAAERGGWNIAPEIFKTQLVMLQTS